MKKIKGKELKAMLDKNEKFKLVEVLGQKQFNEYHLPNAENIPLGERFEEQATQRLPDKSEKVVVYCKDTECEASEKAAKKLEDMGYTQVVDYEAGKEDWKSLGYAIAS